MYQVPFRLVLMIAFQPLGAEVDRRLRKLAAGAVHQYVQPAVRGPYPLEKSRDGVRLANVENRMRGLEAFGCHRRDDARQLFRVASGHDHLRAQPAEQPGDGAADAARAAGHQNDLAREQIRRKNGGMDGQRLGVETEAFRVAGSGISHGASYPSTAHRK